MLHSISISLSLIEKRQFPFLLLNQLMIIEKNKNNKKTRQSLEADHQISCFSCHAFNMWMNIERVNITPTCTELFIGSQIVFGLKIDILYSFYYNFSIFELKFLLNEKQYRSVFIHTIHIYSILYSYSNSQF